MGEVRTWSFDHPKAKIRLRELWAIARGAARRLHLRAPFEPPEFGDLRTLGAPVGPRFPPPAGPTAETGAGVETVLVLALRGWSTHVVIEALLGHALARRGARPVFATCGGRLPICDVVPTPTAPPMPCRSCAGYVRDALASAGFDHLELRELVDFNALTAAASVEADALRNVASCAAYTHDGHPIGEWVRTSVLWSTARGTLEDDDPLVLPTYRAFIVSGVVLVAAFTELLARVDPQHLFLLNGSFFAERILAELADARGVHVVRYERGFFDSSLMVSRWRRDRSLVHPGERAWETARDRPLDDNEEQAVDRYLRGRTVGIDVRYGPAWTLEEDDAARVRKDLDLEPGRDLVVAYTNVLWDSATQDQDRAFPSLADWLLDTIEWATRHPELDLVIRAHPSEIAMHHHVTREPVAERIGRRFPELPPNVRFIPPESLVSSYTLAAMADVGLVYTSTIGLEMAAEGIPVVAAGAPHYVGRGFTFDPASPDEYWSTVDALLAEPEPEAVSQHRRTLARRYVHLFFFRFHQRIDRLVTEPGQGQVRLALRDPSGLEPGADPTVDRLVEAILGLDDVLVTPETDRVSGVAEDGGRQHPQRPAVRPPGAGGRRR